MPEHRHPPRLALILVIALLTGAPVGHAAATGPVRPAPRLRLELDPGLEVFGGYRVTVTEGEGGSRQWFHDFDLGRAHLWLGARYGGAHARITLEAVRSASEGALLGVAGDSLVTRLRQASVGYDLWRWVTVDVGLVPTLVQPTVEANEGLRPIGMGPHEALGILSPADLGARARLHLPRGLGDVAVAGYNGEGYRSRELNRGKNVEALVHLHPLATVRRGAPLSVVLGYENGSLGTGLARNDRLTAHLAWAAPWVRAGVAFTYLWGYAGDGGRIAWMVHAHVGVRLLRQRLLLGARAGHFRRDAGTPEDALTWALGTVGWRISAPLEIHLAVGRTLAGEATRVALPGADQWQIQLLGRFVIER